MRVWTCRSIKIRLVKVFEMAYSRSRNNYFNYWLTTQPRFALHTHFRGVSIIIAHILFETVKIAFGLLGDFLFSKIFPLWWDCCSCPFPGSTAFEERFGCGLFFFPLWTFEQFFFENCAICAHFSFSEITAFFLLLGTATIKSQRGNFWII